jgi:hypothetical protein
VEKENILEDRIDSLMRRLEKMEIKKKEAQDLKAIEARSTCEECREYGHVHKDCPEEAKVLDYMRKGDLPNVVWTSLGPLPRWVPGPTTQWAPGTTRLVPHDT